ncbi:hypothetical protein ACFQVC_32325 [Streptomyces monticola]|uniref:Uncharacterized protein n=1 Tax=Streptomyces monticola TaxID=2666263 RepID=A0ABW2JRS7_9ACTN
MNIFSGAGIDLDLTNGGTEVFAETLMLAVSDLAEAPWDFRFAALLNRQDQNVMGRGAVAFCLEDIDWGSTAEYRARAKDFVLRAILLALQRHRWDELGYEPPYAEQYLRQFHTMVDAHEPAPAPPLNSEFPGPDEAAIACCAQHRLLSALPMWDCCLFCHRTLYETGVS